MAQVKCSRCGRWFRAWWMALMGPILCDECRRRYGLTVSL